MAQFSFSQAPKFSVEANLPISLSPFFGKDYNGVVDVGAKYRIVTFSHVNLGVGINGSYFKRNGRGSYRYPYGDSEIVEDPDVTNFTILPKLFAELNLERLPKLHPFVGAGYGFLLFNAADHGARPQDSVTENGLNLNAGIYYLLNKNIFAQFQYDFINSTGSSDQYMESDNSSISILKLGLGILL